MIFFDNSKKFLEDIIIKAKEYLATYRLKVHPLKVVLEKTENGFIFLGHKVFKTHFRLTSKAIRRGRRKLIKTKYLHNFGKLSTATAKNKIFGTIGFFKLGNNFKISEELLLQTVLVNGLQRQ